ncbi:MAG: hypothetical protein WDO24_23025 [Pseudomonadota bacterium]
MRATAAPASTCCGQLFVALGLRQDARALALVRSTLSSPARCAPRGAFPARQRSRPDLRRRADRPVPERPRTHPTRFADCLALLADCDLRFQGWYANRAYHPEGHFGAGAALQQAIGALDPPAMWAAMELVSMVDTGHHSFFACRPDRDPARYAIDFSGHGFLDYVPVIAGGTSATPADGAAGTAAVVRRQGASVTLDDNQVVLLKRVDGVRSIRQILKSAMPTPQRRARPDRWPSRTPRARLLPPALDARHHPDPAEAGVAAAATETTRYSAISA